MSKERPDREDINAGQVGMCPYFRRDRGHGIVNCECATLKFPDKQARREILYRYCAHPTGYNDCPLKQALDDYYQRRFETGGKP